MKLPVEKFGGEGGEQYNVLASALHLCGKDIDPNENEYPEYLFIEETPRTSLVVHIVNKLWEMGYKITKK